MFSRWTSTERLIAREWLEIESKKTRLGRNCRCCPRCCFSRECVESMYIFNGALCIISLVLLVVFGAGIVAPFHKSLKFSEANCTTLSISFTEKPQSCVCSSRHCRSIYPCVRLTVGFVTSEGLYTETQLHHSQYDRGACTYNPKCRRSRDANNNDVQEFVSLFGVINLTYPCLYDPRDVGHVIIRRYGDHHRMLNLLLWPGLATLLFGAGLLIPFMICGCRFLWTRHPPQSIREEALQRARGVSTSEYLQMDTSTAEA